MGDAMKLHASGEDHLFPPTHPLRGATWASSPAGSSNYYFNPRTPCGVRLVSLSFGGFWTGYFNPRTPCGVRRHVDDAAEFGIKFQPTHPLRGATRLATAGAAPAAFQPTHPLRGATPTPGPECSSGAYFNPRTPCGVRPPDKVRMLRAAKFQPTHPLRGATLRPRLTPDDEPWISTHAPLAGCDISD